MMYTQEIWISTTKVNEVFLVHREQTDFFFILTNLSTIEVFISTKQSEFLDFQTPVSLILWWMMKICLVHREQSDFFFILTNLCTIEVIISTNNRISWFSNTFLSYYSPHKSEYARPIIWIDLLHIENDLGVCKYSMQRRLALKCIGGVPFGQTNFDWAVRGPRVTTCAAPVCQRQ